VYEIKYFSGGNLVYTNYFTIIKKAPAANISTETPAGTQVDDPNLGSRDNPEP
jgi:hypothetical protein